MQADTTFELPEPDASSRRHSEQVVSSVREAIGAAGGSISFAEFMQHALYEPGLGYYVAGNRKFGKAGDFVTAPEVSPIFSHILAGQVAGIFQQISGGSVLELGAGSGVMAADMLCRLRDLEALPDRYLILEVSAELQQRQQRLFAERVPDLTPYIAWLDRLPENFTGVIVANEVADALPVEQFVVSADEIRQLRVGISESGFDWHAAVAPPPLAAAVANIERDVGRKLEDGYRSEVSLGLGPWVRELCNCLGRGAIFMFDYGVSRREYYAPDRHGGWLRCHYRHRAHSDPLILPGIQDLTAWVDFTTIAEAASDSAMHIAGFVTQSCFLTNGGLERELESLMTRPQVQQSAVAQQVRLMTLPGEMGENFKCIGITSADCPPPSGFAFGDRAHVL